MPVNTGVLFVGFMFFLAAWLVNLIGYDPSIPLNLGAGLTALALFLKD